jgi:hypothetical protein
MVETKGTAASRSARGTKGSVRQQKLEAVANAMEILAHELRQLALADDEGKDVYEEKKSRAAEKGTGGKGCAVGRRVRVKVKGKYYGQTGEILSRRGAMYWNVRLDAGDGEVPRIIYKMASSLEVVPP